MVLNQILHLFEEGTSIDAFRRCLEKKEKIIFGSTDDLNTRILKKSFEVGIHSFVDKAEENYSCSKCPAPLEEGKSKLLLSNCMRCEF